MTHDVSDIAEAYLEAFREVGTVMSIKASNGTISFTCNKGWDRYIRHEAIEFHNALLDAAEDEGWDISEMALLDSRDVEEMATLEGRGEDT